jgi:antitoxin (DNA-binding transcriptional repressor) of toxin-antitoxin stability system
MAMKVINVSELKAHLSRYLRMASRGSRIVVKDRDEPIAEIGPPEPAALDWRERLTRSGRLRPGSQRWEDLQVSKLSRPVDIMTALRTVREDPSEIRGR